MKKLLLTIVALSLNANAEDLRPSDPDFQQAIPTTAMSGVYSLLLDDTIVSAPAPDTGEGTCSIIIDGVLYTYWCDVNEPLPEFGNE